MSRHRYGDYEGEFGLLAACMEQAVEALKRHHARLLKAWPEVEALFDGHRLTYTRRKALLALLEDWGMERGWFMCSDWGEITLTMVCAAANSEPQIVREFYAKWLQLPFDPERLYRRLKGLRNVRNECGKCARARRKAEARDCAERRAVGERLARSNCLSVPGTSSFCRTQAARRRAALAATCDREATPTPWLRRLLSVERGGSGGVAA